MCVKRSNDYEKKSFLQFLDRPNIPIDLMMGTIFYGNFNQSYKVFFLRKVIGPKFLTSKELLLGF